MGSSLSTNRGKKWTCGPCGRHEFNLVNRKTLPPLKRQARKRLQESLIAAIRVSPNRALVSKSKTLFLCNGEVIQLAMINNPGGPGPDFLHRWQQVEGKESDWIAAEKVLRMVR